MHRMVTATFRFYEELNDFLAPERRRREFTVPCARAATTQHMIEALGVPHTEVELILLNGASVGFGTILREGDRVAVYPKFEAFDIAPLLRVREQPLRDIRFVADTHLGSLARMLRMMGFDTLYDNSFADDEIERMAAAQGRIVLTRDRDLLKRRMAAMCTRCGRSSSCARSSSGSNSRAAPGLSHSARSAMRRCMPSPRHRWSTICRRACASATSVSAPARSAGACSGRERTGSACALWSIVLKAVMARV
jgi:hypothetical protein